MQLEIHSTPPTALAALLEDLEALDQQTPGQHHPRTVLRLLQSSETGRSQLRYLRRAAEQAQLSDRPWSEVAVAVQASQGLDQLLLAPELDRALDQFNLVELGPLGTVCFVRIAQHRLQRGIGSRPKLRRILERLLSHPAGTGELEPYLVLLPRLWNASDGSAAGNQAS